MNADCFYCMKDQRLDDLMIEVAPLQVSTLYFFKEQTHPGRCIVALNSHKSELFDLSVEDQALFAQDMAKAAAAIAKVYSPQKINYAAFGDKLPHLHFHLVPKYENGAKWGTVFDMMPEERIYLSEEAYQDQIQSLRHSL